MGENKSDLVNSSRILYRYYYLCNKGGDDVARTKKILAPTYTELIVPTYKALLELGGSVQIMRYMSRL